MPDQGALRFEEGQTCPIKIQGGGGGLSFSPNGDMLLIGTFPNPTNEQIRKWGQKWRAKLVDESEFPSIPIFAIGDDEDWFLEAPCNPGSIELESPGFCEALFAKDICEMISVLVNSETSTIIKISRVVLDEMFIERLVLAWNPYRHKSSPGAPAEYSRAFNDQEFTQKVEQIFKAKTSEELWRTSW